MKLKFKKTPWNKRNVYKYIDANGSVVATICPDADAGVSEVHIKLLHQMDDMEVYGNLKNHTVVAGSDADMEIHADWSKPSRWVLSLDRMVDEDDEGFKENREMLEAASCVANEQSRDAQRELLYEAVSYLQPKQQELFRLRYVDGMTETAIAKRLGISVPAVSKRMKKIENSLKEIIFEKILGQG